MKVIVVRSGEIDQVRLIMLSLDTKAPELTNGAATEQRH